MTSAATRPGLRLLLALLAVSLLAAGCMQGLSQPSPKKRYYTLNPQRDAAPLLAQPAAGRLKVRRLAVAASFDTQELVYKLKGGGFVTDYYHLFLAAPGDQAAQALTRWIRDAGIFETVLSPTSSTNSPYILETSIDELYADYDASPSKAVVRLHAILLHDTGLKYDVVMDRTYDSATELRGSDAADAVAGMEAGLASMFGALEQDLATALATQEQN
ncbi:ABC-type transport auxiliary lipoprotein family protein [Oceanidesulfovibrio marinus]|uniref:ABC-type transport auxiliary lipoprotein component domain-containing protein n=1 Tax=Oceanidesulfovibrio marinus TaxID=370038 RepID=A0ABX6NA98_9BACT|nr:ABC-type transport auxiliary lipoprotein family protein [Oceanidesulfovibrio marinus]QJT07517.1 hypothetical protein E8L03_00660 [Oceanidesulfovibrio marinus]